MVTWMGVLAALLYVIPLTLVAIARSRRDRRLWEMALDIPLLVALDLLGILLLARFVTLQNAILISRPAWALAGVAGIVIRRRKGLLAWPSALSKKGVAIVLIAAAASVVLSMGLSRVCHNADRAWHIPLVSSLQAQRIPFSNVYEPGGLLAYHYTGDVYGAIFQTLSMRVIHASHALALAHDVAFGLTGASIALLLLWLHIQHPLAVTAVALSTLLAGPLTFLRPDRPNAGGGYNFINFLKLSFRPHVCLAGLLMVGFLGVVMVHLRRGREEGAAHPAKTIPVLLICTAVLAITDEASVGVLGLALGLTWLAAPEIVHPRRLPGIAVFLGLLAAFIIPNVVFAASLAPGAPRHEISLVPWRSPGYFNPILALSTAKGRQVLFYDMFPLAATLIGGAILALLRWTRERAVSVLFFAAMLVVSFVLLTRVDVDHLPVENHRFVTAVMFLFPLFGSWWLARDAWTGALHALSRYVVASSFVIGAMALSSLSSLEWWAALPKGQCTKPSRYSSAEDFFKTNCREDAGAELGARVFPKYMAQPVWYVHAGCHPVYSAGPAAAHWQIKVGLARFGDDALREVDKDMLRPDEPLQVICPPADVKTNDAACLYARKRDRCRPLGTKTTACDLSAEERRELVASLPKKAPKKPPATRKPPPATDQTDSTDPPEEIPGQN